MAKNPLYLIGMKVTNFLKVENFDYQFDGKSVKLAGPNASGKTTLLRAIWAACLGKAQIPADTINNGKDKAEIEIDLGQYVVKRTITKKDAYLTITNAEGFKAGNPQTILDGLVGQIALDPHAFMETDPKKQAEQAGVIFGVSKDLDKIDQAIKTIFDERTYINRRCKELEVKLTGTKPEPLDLEPVNIDELEESARHYESLDAGYREARRNQDLAIGTIDRMEATIKDLEERLALARKTLDQAVTEKLQAEKVMGEITEAAKRLPEREEINRKIAEGKETNAKLDRHALALDAWEKQAKEFDQVEEKSTELSAAIDKLRAERQGVIASAKIPVDGLGFQDGILTYHDHPLANASHAEQLRVATAILMSQDPTLKLLTIKDASLMDKASWDVVEELAKKHQFQVLYEIVSDDSSQSGIFIEDGVVTHVDGKKVDPVVIGVDMAKGPDQSVEVEIKPKRRGAPRSRAEKDNQE